MPDRGERGSVDHPDAAGVVRTPPMRLTLAAVALVVAVGPGWAAVSDDRAMATSCRTYLSSYGSAAYSDLVDAVSNRLSASPNSGRFGSTCNMSDYVRAECKAHPGDDVRRAIDRLERAGAIGRLPLISMCGA